MCCDRKMSGSLLDVFSPLHAMSKFCGYSVFTINRVDFSVAVERVDVLLQIWIIIINCCLNFCLWDASQNFAMHKSDIISKSLPIILCGSYGLYLFCVIASVATRTKQSILIRSICEIDEMVNKKMNCIFHWLTSMLFIQLKEFGVQFDYQREKRVVIFAICGIILAGAALVVQCLVIQQFSASTTNMLPNAFIYYWNIQCYTIFIFNFVFMVYTVKQRFAGVNDCLK